MNLKSMLKLGCNETILIWDREEEFPDGVSPIILWSRFSESQLPSIISLPKFVEDHAEYLRHRYLEWIYNMRSHILPALSWYTEHDY